MDGDAAVAETFATYFARTLIARKGFQPVAPPEAQPLIETCDFVLTKADGLNCEIAAILDRESHQGRTFAPTPLDVQGIAEACRRYTGTMHGTQLSAIVNVYEIGPGVVEAGTIDRLTPYRREERSRKGVVIAWALDTASGRAWCNQGWLFRRLRLPPLERLLRGPRLPESALVPPAPLQLAAPGRPLFTYLLLALLALVFACEQVFGIGQTSRDLSPSIETLVALGGTSRSLVLDFGEWWRIFTAPLLHGGLAHIFFNGLALFLVGRLLERLVGSAWFAALFAISAVCGALMSLAINPADVIGVGASGGIVGLFAASLVIALRLPSGVMRSRLVSGAIQSLVPALIPFLNAFTSGAQIDYGAHFGGAIGGAVAAFALLPLWPADRPHPRLLGLAAGLAALFFLGAAWSIVPIGHAYRLQALLAPDFPKDRQVQEARADDLVRDYPRDPRARLVRALRFLKDNDVAAAQDDLRAGLAETDLLSDVLPPDNEIWLRTVLAVTLMDQGKRDEGLAIARPICGKPRSGQLANIVASAGLCL